MGISLRQKRQHISKKECLTGGCLLFLLIPFFRPDVIGEMPRGATLNQIFIAWRIAAFLLAFAKYGICFVKKPKIEGGLFFICIYEAVLLYSSVKNQEMVRARVIDIANFLGVYFIYACYGRQSPRLFIRVNYRFFSFLVWVNVGLTIVFPHGLNKVMDDSARVNFLGKDNTITLLFLLSMVFCALYHNLFPRNPGPFFTAASIFVIQMFYGSGSGVVATAGVVCYLCLVSDNKLVNRLLDARLLFLVYMALELVIVFFNQVGFLNPLFHILNKASTFTDRRYYWMAAFYQLKASPLLGQGSGITYLWGNNYYSHNSLLDILLKGGILGAVLWCVMVLFLMRQVKLRKNLRVKGFIACCFFAYLLVGLMEGLEDRIAFNAFLALLPVLEDMEEKQIFRNVLINPGIRIKSRFKVKAVLERRDRKRPQECKRKLCRKEEDYVLHYR